MTVPSSAVTCRKGGVRQGTVDTAGSANIPCYCFRAATPPGTVGRFDSITVRARLGGGRNDMYFLKTQPRSVQLL